MMKSNTNNIWLFFVLATALVFGILAITKYPTSSDDATVLLTPTTDNAIQKTQLEPVAKAQSEETGLQQGDIVVADNEPQISIGSSRGKKDTGRIEVRATDSEEKLQCQDDMLTNMPNTEKAFQEQLETILAIAEQPETQSSVAQPNRGGVFDAFGNLFEQSDEKQQDIDDIFEEAIGLFGELSRQAKQHPDTPFGNSFTNSFAGCQEETQQEIMQRTFAFELMKGIGQTVPEENQPFVNNMSERLMKLPAAQKLLKGMIALNIEQYDNALNCFQQAQNLFKMMGDKSGEARAIASMGQVYVMQGELEKAENAFNRALTLFNQINNEEAQNDKGEIFLNFGLMYLKEGDYDKALKYFKQAQQLYQETHNRYGEAGVLAYLGMVHNQLGQYERALDYVEQAKAIFEAPHVEQGEKSSFRKELDKLLTIGNKANTYKVMGMLYMNLGHPKEALNAYQKALKIGRDFPGKRLDGYALYNIAIVYAYCEQYLVALEKIQQA